MPIVKATNGVVDQAKIDATRAYIRDHNCKTILDIGGAMNPWLKDVTTAYFDIQDVHQLNPTDPTIAKSLSFVGDVCSASDWNQIIKYLSEHGSKFDFAVCSHVIEDIRNPEMVLSMMQKIAHAGLVCTPSKYREMGFVENFAPQDMQLQKLASPYIGYCHHRWICTVQGNVLVLFPKLACLTSLYPVPWFDENSKHNKRELMIFWERDLPFKFFNGDFMGPDPQTVFKFYRENLAEGI